jgi:8-demethyl-8-alpha-L-rhamnosyltetracenomycin-C 2'-O-methyltransferase
MKRQPWLQPSEEIVSILEKFDINGFDSPGGTDKNTIHNYTGIYEYLLKPYQDKKGTLLELGVQHGGSSLLWYNYLPHFYLHLIDITSIAPDKIWDAMKTNRYQFHKRNGYCNETVQYLTPLVPDGFDIIIDDGPHTLQSQIFAVNFYFPMLKPGGILIIEDIQDSNHLSILTDYLKAEDVVNVEVYDVRRTKGRYDDLIWVCRKK